MPPDRLTPQQRRFADGLLEGLKPWEAYAHAYPNQSMKRLTLQTEASKQARNPKIKAYVDAGIAEARREVLLTRDKKRQILGSIALDKSAPKHARILAVKTDNEMTGDNAPVRVEGEITLGLIFSSMRGTTGLPGPEDMKAVGPIVDIPELPDEAPDDLIPAMEQAGGAR